MFLVVLLTVTTVFSVSAQDKDHQEILALLNDQTISWNKGDLDSFMKTYWNNDSLMFVGKESVTYGYQNTLYRYKKNYDSPDKMGKLFFDVLNVKKLSAEYFFVLGKWFLKRNAGDVGGHYTLLLRKIKGRWLIISDHSS